MNKITQEEFNELPMIDRYRICPGFTDYADVKKFGNNCKFGTYCEFGNYCKFGTYCEFGNNCKFGNYCEFGTDCSIENSAGIVNSERPFVSFTSFGSKNRTTYAFNLDTGIYVRCGCFLGTLAQFVKRVKDTHSGNKYAKDYLLIAKLIGQTFKEKNERSN